jgi:hypothetical protein
MGKNGVHHAPGLFVSPKISASYNDRVTGVIKLVYFGAVAVPLRRQPGKDVFPYLFHAVVRSSVGKTGRFCPFKARGQRGLKVFRDLLGIAFVNPLDRF